MNHRLFLAEIPVNEDGNRPGRTHCGYERSTGRVRGPVNTAIKPATRGGACRYWTHPSLQSVSLKLQAPCRSEHNAGINHRPNAVIAVFWNYPTIDRVGKTNFASSRSDSSI
jgi:hypothetical protein